MTAVHLYLAIGLVCFAYNFAVGLCCDDDGEAHLRLAVGMLSVPLWGLFALFKFVWAFFDR